MLLKEVVSAVASVFVLIGTPCVSSPAIAKRVGSELVPTMAWESTSMKIALSSLKGLRRSLNFTPTRVVDGFVASFANIVALPSVGPSR